MKVRLMNTLGCSILSTAVLQSIRNYTNKDIEVYTPFPELFEHLPNITTHHQPESDEDQCEYDIDLREYLGDYIYKAKDNEAFRERHILQHMFDVTEKQLQISLDRDFEPKLVFSNKEIQEMKDIVTDMRTDKPIVWTQTKSRKKEKEWSQNNWKLLKKSLPQYHFIEPENHFTYRQSILFTKYCDAGVCLDSFLMHGSHVVQAPNVIVLLTATPESMVAYTDQTVLDGFSNVGATDIDNVINILQSKV